MEQEVPLNERTVISEDDVVQFIQKLEPYNEEQSKIVLSVLKNPNIVRYFKYNQHQYCELLAQTISGISSVTELLNYTKNESLLQKAIVERDGFYLNFIKFLLVPLIKVAIQFESNHEVFEEISRIIQKCLFSRNYQTFESALVDQKKNDLFKALFKFLVSLYNQDFANIGFKVILNAFVKSYNNFGITYRFFVLFVEILGFETNFPMISKLKFPKTVLSKSIQILNELFDVLINRKLELDTKINDVSFTDFLRDLLKSIIALSKIPNSSCYNILYKIIEINPIIIESIISEIIVYIMLANNSKFKLEYEDTMIKTFEVFSKLHRIQNFISKMIPTLKQAIENGAEFESVYTFRGDLDFPGRAIEKNVQNIFSPPILDYFTSCIAGLASWQAINLYKTILYHLTKAVENLSESQEEFMYLEILSTLTCWVLQSVRIAEHTVSSNTVEKFVAGLEEMRMILSKFASALLHREHNHILMRAFLKICYYWAEIYITLEYYSINNEVHMKKIQDNNTSCSNLTYLHSYLSNKEWCLISERIRNFGAESCKVLLQKLIVQKLRALLIFENNIEDEVIMPIVRYLSTDFHIDIFTEQFVVNQMLHKFPSAIILNISEGIVTELLDGNDKIYGQAHINDSPLVIEGCIAILFAKINKLMKQKRKLDETSLKKTYTSQILLLFPGNVPLECPNSALTQAADILTNTGDPPEFDLKLNQIKIMKYLDGLKRLPLIFCSENVQKLTLLVLIALLKDLNASNCDLLAQKNCESIIISLVQHSKLNLIDLFAANDLLNLIVQNFDRADDLFAILAQNIFKTNKDIANFSIGINHIKDNINDVKCLSFALILLNIMGKVKRTKLSQECKDLCQSYKSLLCNKIVKFVTKNSPEHRLIEPFAIVLKTFLTKDENDNLSKLKACLGYYIDFSLSNLSSDNIKGSLLLFVAILHHKTVLSTFDNNFVLRIWRKVKKIPIGGECLEEYSQLLMLITTQIPNEQFSEIFNDLMMTTEASIEAQDKSEFCKNLTTWGCILTTNFNSVKTQILREQLELVLEKLILMVKLVQFEEVLFSEIIQFEVSIIQTNHVPLTSAILDMILMTVSVLMMRKDEDFVNIYNWCMTIMENLLKARNALIMDRLPSYLLQYRIMLRELRVRGNSNVVLEQNETQKIADCAHQLEKLTKGLVECSRDMARISMYLIADILAQYEINTLYPNVKKHLDNCIYSLISLCDQHAVQHLLRILSDASTEIFKIMFENYKKYYRFTGKI